MHYSLNLEISIICADVNSVMTGSVLFYMSPLSVAAGMDIKDRTSDITTYQLCHCYTTPDIIYVIK